MFDTYNLILAGATYDHVEVNDDHVVCYLTPSDRFGFTAYDDLELAVLVGEAECSLPQLMRLMDIDDLDIADEALPGEKPVDTMRRALIAADLECIANKLTTT